MVSRVSDKHAALIEKTKAFWQAYASYPLTDNDADEIIHNVTALFTLLADLDEKGGSSTLTLAARPENGTL